MLGNMLNDLAKAIRRWTKKKSHKEAFTDAFTHRDFYTQTLLHTDTFTRRHFYTQTISHTDAFTHRHFTQKLLHTEPFTHGTFTHRHFYTQTLLHTDAFTRRCFYTHTHTQRLLHTEAFTHRRFYTQTLLHTEAFTHRRFYTQTLLQTEAFIHGNFYTQTLLHTDTFTQREAFTHRRFYTQTFLHTEAFTHRGFLQTEAFTSVLCRRYRNLQNPWVSVQDVVLNSLRPSTQPSQPLPELSHFYQTHKHRNMSAHVAMVLVGVSRLDTKMMESPVSIFLLTFTKAIKNTCPHKKSLHQDMVCLFK